MVQPWNKYSLCGRYNSRSPLTCFLLRTSLFSCLIARSAVDYRQGRSCVYCEDLSGQTKDPVVAHSQHQGLSGEKKPPYRAASGNDDHHETAKNAATATAAAAERAVQHLVSQPTSFAPATEEQLTPNPTRSNNQKPRYRCPRCATRTCSLPCYKRHQQWSQCSGKRDPTAYVKKSQLVTPAGIDHDYNFLTGVERALDRAGRQNVDMRLHGGGRSSKRLADPIGSLQKRLTWSRVIVDRAPVGMTRQKVNETRWNSK